MNKSELIAALAEKTELSKKDAEKALNSFVDAVSGSLAKGEKVQLIGFGTFDVKKRPARMARNPAQAPKSRLPLPRLLLSKQAKL